MPDKTPPAHYHVDGDLPMLSTLGELRALIDQADELGAPDESMVYVTVQPDGATRHGSRLRGVAVVTPGAAT